MKRASGILAILLLSSVACGDPEGEGAPESPGVRGSRYCEVLLAYEEGTNIRIDVHNTYGLNDCPAEQWDDIDTQQIKQEFQASAVILNGPRYWVLDGFVNSTFFLDGAQEPVGGIEMRKAGELQVPRSAMSSFGASYAVRSIMRNTTFVFDAGESVYELVDPLGQVFVMQSFRGGHADVSTETLSTLGEKLAPPAGWTWRTRQLSQELRVTAVDGVAKIVQDELGSTYQLSQQ